jgi:hypothetical protein
LQAGIRCEVSAQGYLISRRSVPAFAAWLAARRGIDAKLSSSLPYLSIDQAGV